MGGMVSLLVNVHEAQHGDEELGEPDEAEQCHDQHGQGEEDVEGEEPDEERV